MRQERRISIHAPRTGSDGGGISCFWKAQTGFQSTLPARGATRGGIKHGKRFSAFQSTLPARGATSSSPVSVLYSVNFNPRSPHGERRKPTFVISVTISISIHAPRTGSDSICRCCIYIYCYFNPRSPHGERRNQPFFFVGVTSRFQSTLPARGATRYSTIARSRSLFQSTLPARGATCAGHSFPSEILFQSTLPARGATSAVFFVWQVDGISIHAPRTGSDVSPFLRLMGLFHFNPRSPHGERRVRGNPYAPLIRFQSTLPARGATALLYSHQRKPHFNPRSPHGERRPRPPLRQKQGCISIHAPRTGSDRGCGWQCSSGCHFNPRSPHGERPFPFQPAACRRHFNPRSPHGERRFQSLSLPRCFHFNPRSPHGERLDSMSSNSMKSSFQSTLPARGATKRPAAARMTRHFNPRSPHGERLVMMRSSEFGKISIHAPRTGSDRADARHGAASAEISIHAPRTGSDRCPMIQTAVVAHFNPRSPHGERLNRFSHLPCIDAFQSTLPARGATSSFL